MRLIDIGPTDEWAPGFRPDPPARLQRSWRVDVIKAMRYLRKRAGGEAVETPQSWWTAHLEAALVMKHKYSDEHGLPRVQVPPDLRRICEQPLTWVISRPVTSTSPRIGKRRQRGSRATPSTSRAAVQS